MKDVANYSQSNINTIKNVVPFLLKKIHLSFFWTVLIYTAAVTNCHTF